jgi:hypothetical protein
MASMAVLIDEIEAVGDGMAGEKGPQVLDFVTVCAGLAE